MLPSAVVRVGERSEGGKGGKRERWVEMGGRVGKERRGRGR